ncbi:unnamed protein product [Moneuplotes crassus]|uniref:Uncharacterized protein n=1 Tax=Euplotes crassus TaxID=5936 RepID=A0AAD1Y672_EUPCR|nr:unnamed protein product [Moneuplotes crassus]
MDFKEKVVDSLFIGGGPATLAIICKAIEDKKLASLIKRNSIAILEKSGSFGGGELQFFGINSNTSAQGFVNCIPKTDKERLLAVLNLKRPSPAFDSQMTTKQSEKDHFEEKKFKGKKQVCYQISESNQLGTEISPESVQDIIQDSDQQISLSDKLPREEIDNLMLHYEWRPAPLSLIGTYLNYVGNQILNKINIIHNQKIFHPFTEVINIKQVSSGDILVKAKSTRDHESNIVHFRAKRVVLANGGKPTIPSTLSEEIPSEKLIVADHLLKKDGFNSFVTTLNDNPGKRKIVIIGGSHSGFSAAWILLNGPACYNHNKGLGKLIFKGIMPKQVIRCADKFGCGSQYCDAPVSSNPKQSQACHCFGTFDTRKIWKFDEAQQLPQFSDSEITILYKDKIKVYFHDSKDAYRSGYKAFKKCDIKKEIYPLTGLRGDAKNLYLDVIKGREKRVRLMKVKDFKTQKSIISKADYVILSCGYHTSPIPILNVDDEEVKLAVKVPGTQCEVDSQLRLMTADGGVCANIFGVGLAYPAHLTLSCKVTKSSSKYTRADAFQIYNNAISGIILKNLLPRSKNSLKNHFFYSKRVPQKKESFSKERHLKKKQERINKEFIYQKYKSFKRTFNSTEETKISEGKPNLKLPKFFIKKSFPSNSKTQAKSFEGEEQITLSRKGEGTNMKEFIQNYIKGNPNQRLNSSLETKCRRNLRICDENMKQRGHKIPLMTPERIHMPTSLPVCPSQKVKPSMEQPKFALPKKVLGYLKFNGKNQPLNRTRVKRMQGFMQNKKFVQYILANNPPQKFMNKRKNRAKTLARPRVD